MLTFAGQGEAVDREVLIAGTRARAVKVNEVIDVELDTIVDISKIKKNRDKIADQYVQKGFYLATVDYEIRPVNDTEVDVWFTIDEKAKVKIRDVSSSATRRSPTTSCATRSARAAPTCCRS